MKTVLRSFFIRLLIFSFVIAVVAAVLWVILPAGSITPALPPLIVFFFAATYIVFRLLIIAALEKFSNFTRKFMIATFVKLLIYGAILVLYVFLNRADAFPFTIAYFLLYAGYTIFEVNYFLSATAKKN